MCHQFRNIIEANVTDVNFINFIIINQWVADDSIHYDLLVSCLCGVLGVPKEPEDVEVTDIFAKSCVVSWKKPQSDGGDEITKYVIERQDLSKKGQLVIVLCHRDSSQACLPYKSLQM